MGFLLSIGIKFRVIHTHFTFSGSPFLPYNILAWLHSGRPVFVNILAIVGTISFTPPKKTKKTQKGYIDHPDIFTSSVGKYGGPCPPPTLTNRLEKTNSSFIYQGCCILVGGKKKGKNLLIAKYELSYLLSAFLFLFVFYLFCEYTNNIRCQSKTRTHKYTYNPLFLRYHCLPYSLWFMVT